MVIEAVTGKDYRDVIRERITEPLGIADDVFIGVPEAAGQPLRDDLRRPGEARDNRREVRAAGLPGGGGYGTARGIAAFYQALLNKGTLNGRRIVSPRLIAYVAKNQTGETGRRGDERHSDASRPRSACARRERPHPRARHHRRAERVRPRRRRLVLFLGRSDQRRVVHLHDQPLRRTSPSTRPRLDRVANIIHAAID